MPITKTDIYSLSNAADQALYATASLDLSSYANQLILAFINSGRAGAVPSAPTSFGITSGLQFTQVATVTFNSVASARSRLNLYRAMSASPGSGVINADWGAETQSGFNLSMFALAGVNIEGTNGSGAIGIVTVLGGDAVVSGIGIVHKYPPLPDNRWQWRSGAVFGIARDSAGATTPFSLWSEVHDINHSSPNEVLETQFIDDTSVLTAGSNCAGATWTGTDDIGYILVEIIPGGMNLSRRRLAGTRRLERIIGVEGVTIY